MAEFENSHGAGGAFEAIAAGQVGPGDTITSNGTQYVVGNSGQLVPKALSDNIASRLSGGSTEVSSSGAGTKYLKTEGAITYGALKVSQLTAADKAAISGSDRHTIRDDGTITFKDTDGTTQVVPQGVDKATIDLSYFSADVLTKAADIQYFGQNTGVSATDMNSVATSFGLDPTDISVSTKVQAILKAAGYTPGDNENFYGSNSAVDVGAQILVERNAQKPTNQDLIDAGIDPNEVTVVNSRTANAYYLEQEMNKRNLNQSDTAGRFGSTTPFLTGKSKNIEELRTEGDNLVRKYQPGYKGSAYELDMLEWDLVKKKKEEEGGTAGGSTNSGSANVVTGGNYNTGQYNPTGGDSGSSYTGPNFVSTPNLNTVTPNTPSGTYEVNLPNYSKCLDSQMTQFKTRATDQAKMYQPQTQSEMEQKALNDPEYEAPAFENVQYTNRFGMSMYVQHINGKPTQPIPPGYTRVAVVEANQGGMIQGYNEGNLVNPALNFKPGGTVEEAEGGFRINYGGENGSSQLYGSAEDAGAANQQGLSNIGLPDYNAYLSQQGVDQSLGGYDETAYQTAYQSYISDPATLEQMSSDAAAKAASEAAAAQTANIGGEQAETQTGVTVEELEQANRDLSAQATIAPGGAVAAAPVSYLDPNQYGTVTESTAGQALGTAPMVTSDQVAQIETATQAIGPGYEGFSVDQYRDMALDMSVGKIPYEARFDPDGNGKVTSEEALAIQRGDFVVEPTPEESAYIAPKANQVTANQASTAIKEAVDGKQKVDADGTPLFDAEGNPIMEGGMSASQSTGPTKNITAAQSQKQKVDPTTGQPMFTTGVDADGNEIQVPVMEAASSVSGLDAAQGSSTDVTGEPTRKEETGEMIAGGNQSLSSVDQTKVDATFGTGEVAAASVKDELATLMEDFEGGNTPAWAAGSMRKAMAVLSARGIGASSMAGQAIVQAAMEAALPIAQIDTANKQQVAMFKAEQRASFLQMDFDQDFQAKVANAAKVSEIANLNFTAEQQVALENSKNANSMNIANLSAKNALVLSEAAALAQMDVSNLNNLQTAAVQNAQNFLQIDMANLSNSQQTALYKQQSVVNSILSDQSAANAAQQFNATSQNQTDQFFANLAASVSQFNAAQQNAMKQYNAGEVNSLLEFNAGIQNQREMFNAQNYLVVAQANAQWRQNLSTINTSAANASNMEYAQTVNALTLKNLDEIWQRERDSMDYSFTNSENNSDRALSLLLGELDLTAIRESMKAEEKTALGSLLTKVFFSWGTGKT